MNESVMEELCLKIAKEFNVTPEEVKNDMLETISSAFGKTNNDEAERNLQRLLHVVAKQNKY